MRRFAILLLALLALAPTLWMGQMVLAESGVMQKPPPPPPPDKESKAPPPPTPERLKPTVPPTPIPMKPTIPPTPALAQPTAPSPHGDESSVPSPSLVAAATPTQPASRDRGVAPTPDAAPASRLITGRVFDDRNGNGAQDKEETGVGGVPVTLNGQVVAATDANGQFTVQLVADAWLAVVPPQGWQWSGLPWPGDAPGPVVIPLRRADAQSTPVTAAAANTMTGGIVLAVIGLLALNLFGSWSQSAAVRSLERAYRRHKSQELELTMAREIADHRERLSKTLESDSDAWRALATQLFAGVGLGHVAPSSIQSATIAPCPSLTIAGLDDLLYAFTTDPSPLGQHGRVIPLDASVSLFARVEAHTLWDHAMRRSGGRAMPLHDVAWYLVAPRQQRALLRPRQWNLRLWKKARRPK